MPAGRWPRAALAATAAVVLMGHSPYRQWAVYRETHLLVVAGADAPGAFALGQAVARCLAANVPGSRAVATRARSSGEALALLESRQLPLGLVPGEVAADAAAARGPFGGRAPLPLRTLAVLGPFLLVALDDFPADKARQIADAVAQHPPAGLAPADAPPPIPYHPGARPDRGAGAPER